MQDMKRLKQLKTKLEVNLTDYIISSLKGEDIQIYDVFATARHRNTFLEYNINFNLNYLSQNRDTPFALSYNSHSAYFVDNNFDIFDEIEFYIDNHQIIEFVQNLLNN